MTKTKCFISYSHHHANMEKFEKINNLLAENSCYINFTEKENKSHCTDETIWNYIYGRVATSSCTILLLTEDLLGINFHKISPGYNFKNSGWIYKELSVSLRDWKEKRINGVICVVDDHLWNQIMFPNHFGFRRELPEILEKNKRYIDFIKYSNFLKNHFYYINIAKKKREEQINTNKYQITYDLHTKYKW